MRRRRRARGAHVLLHLEARVALANLLLQVEDGHLAQFHLLQGGEVLCVGVARLQAEGVHHSEGGWGTTTVALEGCFAWASLASAPKRSRSFSRW